jgi:hypothetical protein
MQRITISELIQTLRQDSQQLFSLAARFLKYLMQLPLPALLMACLGIALMLSILPLALSLFVGFLLIKLVVLLFMLKPKQSIHQ